VVGKNRKKQIEKAHTRHRGKCHLNLLMGEICKFNIISLALNFLEPQYPSELM
jgi:hypothetical protein